MVYTTFLWYPPNSTSVYKRGLFILGVDIRILMVWANCTNKMGPHTEASGWGSPETAWLLVNHDSIYRYIDHWI